MAEYVREFVSLRNLLATNGISIPGVDDLKSQPERGLYEEHYQTTYCMVELEKKSPAAVAALMHRNIADIRFIIRSAAYKIMKKEQRKPANMCSRLTYTQSPQNCTLSLYKK